MKTTIKRLMALFSAIHETRHIAVEIERHTKQLAQGIEAAISAAQAAEKQAAEIAKKREQELVQALLESLDHLYAFHMEATARAGNLKLVERTANLGRSCVACAERVGLHIFVAKPGETFDPAIHQQTDSANQPAQNSMIATTLQCGFKLDQQLLRRALVTLQPKRTS